MSLFICHHNTDSTPLIPILPYSLPDSRPTDGNSYSLAIMWRMMCALKCALPDWLPLRRPAGATEEGHQGGGQGCREDRVMTGDRSKAGTMDRDCNYKGEIWPDKQYCASHMSISRGISAAVMLSEGDCRWERKARDRWRGVGDRNKRWGAQASEVVHVHTVQKTW